MLKLKLQAELNWTDTAAPLDPRKLLPGPPGHSHPWQGKEDVNSLRAWEHLSQNHRASTIHSQMGAYKKVLYLGSVGLTSPLPLGKNPKDTIPSMSTAHTSTLLMSFHRLWRGRGGSGGLPLLPPSSLSLCSVSGSLQAQLHPSYPPSACSTLPAKSCSSSPTYNRVFPPAKGRTSKNIWNVAGSIKKKRRQSAKQFKKWSQTTCIESQVSYMIWEWID